MNKKLLFLTVACAALLLAGCAQTSANDVSAYVSPENFGGESVIPASAPSAALPAREKKQRTMPAYQYDAASDTGGTLYTAGMRYSVEGHYFVGEELTFALPEYWGAENFQLRISELTLSGYTARQFLFYFVDPSSAQAALIMKIDAIPQEYQQNYGVEYGEVLGASYDGSWVYIRAAVAGDVPESFAAAEAYRQTLAAISAEGYTIQINV